MSQSGHLELLQLYCRVCGKRGLALTKSSPIRDSGIQLIQNPTFRLLLSRLHDLDIEHESPEIFPKKVGLITYDPSVSLNNSSVCSSVVMNEPE